MKKFLLPFLLSFSIILGGLNVSLTAKRSGMVERVLSSIVYVTWDGEDGQERVCTGFVVEGSAGRALTARHCVGDLDVVRVNGLDSLVVEKSEAFALLSMVGQAPVGALELRKKPLSLTDRVFSFGYGWGYMEVLTRNISIFKGGDFAVDGPFINGMSGGPITDEDGKVVGLIQASNDIIGIACGFTEIRAFLAEP